MPSNIPFKTGSAALTTKFVSATQQISSGVSGDLVTISPPTGQAVSLTSIKATTGAQGGISITVGGTVVVDNKSLDSAQTDVVNRVQIGAYSGGGGDGIVDGVPIIGGVDEDLVISAAAATSQAIVYRYQFLG